LALDDVDWWAEVAPKEAFAALIHPLGLTEFVADFWERGPCLLRAAEGDPVRDRLFATVTLQAVNETLLRVYAAGRRQRDAVYAVRDGQVLPSAAYLTDLDGDLARLDVDKLYEAYRQGASVVVNAVDEAMPAVGAFCDLLTGFLSARVHTTVFITPPRARGFPRHYDTHDVFALQLSGSKEWLLHTPAEQLRTRYFEPGDLAGADDPDRFHVRSGDVIFIPRGTLHEARATHEPSMHLVFGVHPYTVAQLARDLVSDLEAEDESLRRSASFPGPPVEIGPLLLAGLADRERASKLLAAHATALRKHAAGRPGGLFGDR
jgi:ribosomal protein L16 Arg81 hydroxylase